MWERMVSKTAKHLKKSKSYSLRAILWRQLSNYNKLTAGVFF